MATERQAAAADRIRPDFLKFTHIGQSVAGRVARYDSNQNGPLIELDPVLIKQPDGSWHRYGAAAIGLTADLSRKISKQDVKQFFRITFRDTEATGQSDKKIFGVELLDDSEIREIAGKVVDKRQEQKGTPTLPVGGASSGVVDELFGA